MTLNGNISSKPNPTIHALLVGAAEQQRAEVKAELEKIGDPKLIVTDLSLPSISRNGHEQHAADAGEPDVVMLLLSEEAGEEDALNYLKSYADKATRPALFAVLAEHSEDLMRRAVRAGADELLWLPLVPRDVTRALIKVTEARQRNAAREGGVVCSLTSLVGGVGVTSLSANLALALNYEFKRSVALVDLDLQAGMLSILLNLQPECTISALSRPEVALDSIQLRAALTHHPSGLYVLAAPKQIEDAELVGAATVTKVLKLLRQMFDFVIVDSGRGINELTLAAWEESDHVFYVLDQSIGGARCGWRFIRLFERLKLFGARAHFVLDRFQPGFPITPDQLVHTLSRPIYAYIHRDDRAMEGVQLSGKDLWQVAPRSQLTRSVVGLARKLAEPLGAAQEEDDRGFFARLFAGSRRAPEVTK
jgi:pilus assembly protein CpaE